MDILTEEQELFVDEMTNLINREKCGIKFLIAPAGHGKSYGISQLLEDRDDYIVLAPTHKACSILKREGIKAETI